MIFIVTVTPINHSNKSFPLCYNHWIELISGKLELSTVLTTIPFFGKTPQPLPKKEKGVSNFPVWVVTSSLEISKYGWIYTIMKSVCRMMDVGPFKLVLKFEVYIHQQWFLSQMAIVKLCTVLRVGRTTWSRPKPKINITIWTALNGTSIKEMDFLQIQLNTT